VFLLFFYHLLSSVRCVSFIKIFDVTCRTFFTRECWLALACNVGTFRVSDLTHDSRPYLTWSCRL